MWATPLGLTKKTERKDSPLQKKAPKDFPPVQRRKNTGGQNEAGKNFT